MVCRLGVIRSVFLLPTYHLLVSKKSAKEKTGESISSSFVSQFGIGTEEALLPKPRRIRGVLRARKRQVRCTRRDAAPFRDARRDTPRAPEKAHAREARLGLGFQRFACDARARDHFAPRRDGIARGGAAVVSFWQNRRNTRQDGGRRGVGHVQGELPAPEEGARREAPHGGVCYAAG